MASRLYPILNKLQSLCLDVSSANLSGTYLDGSWSVKRVGKVCMLMAVNFKDLPAGSASMPGIVPAEYRPTNNILSYTLIDRITGNRVALSITTTGDITLYNYGSAFSGARPYNMTYTYILY